MIDLKLIRDSYEKNKEYINDVLGTYENCELPNISFINLKDRTIIHLYPTEDCVIDGFRDALFFKMDVYNNHKKYEIHTNDGIDMQVPSLIKIFKDGSTMLDIRQSITISIMQCCTISDLIEENNNG